MIQEAIQKSNCCTFFLWKILLQNRIPTLEKENSNSYKNIICTRKRCNIGTRRTCQALCSLWREFFTASSSLMIPSVNILLEGNSWRRTLQYSEVKQYSPSSSCMMKSHRWYAAHPQVPLTGVCQQRPLFCYGGLEQRIHGGLILLWICCHVTP